MKRKKDKPKPRDPASHLRAQGALRTRKVGDGDHVTKAKKSRNRARLRKEVEDFDE